MKTYEAASDFMLPLRLPVILRLDGRAFHSYTRGFTRPFDLRFQSAMVRTTMALCKEISGAKIGYTQSDEISILVINYDNLETEAYFENRIQKLCSIVASFAAVTLDRDIRPIHTHPEKLPTFDCRVFIVPEAEVCNYMIWRQQDAERNSIQMYAQSFFSHKAIHGLNNDTLQEKMLWEKDFNWNDAPIINKRGIAIIKETYEKDGAARTRWTGDWATPRFTQDRNYIEKFIPTN